MEPSNVALSQQVVASETTNEATISRLHFPSHIVWFVALVTTICIIGFFLYLQTNPFFLHPPNAWWIAIYFKCLISSAIFIILVVVSFILHKKKKYLASLFISMLVIFPSIFFLHKTLQVYRNHLRILAFKADSESLVRGTDIPDQKRNDFAKTEGLLVPGQKIDEKVAPFFSREESLDLSVPGFYYLKYSVATTTLNPKAFLTISESSTNLYSPTAYTQEVAISESVIKNKSDRTLYRFSYAGSPGMIVVAQVTGREDLVSYILNWNDHGKNVSIWMYYVPKDIFTKEQIIDLLGSLERTP